MNDPLIARFASACGATAPLDLRVDLVGGGVLAEGSIDQPFTLVGRDDACDVTLSDPEINPRHAWLQVLGGRVFVADLGSRTGLLWPNGWRGPDWLDPGTPVGIGPFQLRLRVPAGDRAGAYPAGYNPLVADPGDRTRPAVALEFRNGRRAKDRWQVNRVLTLIGRAADCKIHLTADDISPYHCGLVSTPSGLWVVDLSGRGVVVNGERMRVAPLPQGAELWVGRFLIGCQYQTVAGEKSGRLATSRPPVYPVAPGEARLTTTPPPLATEDEVELGAAPDPGELPGSHIMADAFRLWGGGASTGPVSSPIRVSNSNAGPRSAAAAPVLDAPAHESSVSDGKGEDPAVLPLLRQMADSHDRTGAEFQHSLLLLTRVLGRVEREHLAIVQRELSRIQDLTAEISGLQLEVERNVLGAIAERARHPEDSSSADPRSGVRVPPSTRTPLPDGPLTSSPVAARAADRLAALQQDRGARWQALVALFAGL